MSRQEKKSGILVLPTLLQMEENPTIYEVQGPQLSAGDYLMEWTVSNIQDVFDSLETGVVLESDYVLKVSDSGDLVNEENYVRQNISVDFQSNSLPVLVDSNGETSNTSHSRC